MERRLHVSVACAARQELSSFISLIISAYTAENGSNKKPGCGLQSCCRLMADTQWRSDTLHMLMPGLVRSSTLSKKPLDSFIDHGVIIHQ